jgi:hypothetical protein
VTTGIKTAVVQYGNRLADGVVNSHSYILGLRNSEADGGLGVERIRVAGGNIVALSQSRVLVRRRGAANDMHERGRVGIIAVDQKIAFKDTGVRRSQRDGDGAENRRAGGKAEGLRCRSVAGGAGDRCD